MKNGNDVMPYMRIGSLAKNIQEKNDVRNNFKQATALRQASSVPLWSKTLTSPVVTRHAEGILQQQYTLGMKPWFNCVRTDSTTWLVRGGIEKAFKGTPIPKFIRTRTVSQVGTFLLCSCGFFERFGLPCRHLFVVLQRGPRPSNCATRWRRDYLAYGLSGNAELDRLFKEAKIQEPVGPFYSEEQEGVCSTITYPTFIRGEIRDMRYFKNPLEGTLYYIQGCDEIKQSTVVGRMIPEEELPSDLHLSQRSQDFLDKDGDPTEEGFLESTQAYTLLYPTFKQIICLSTGDRKLAALSFDALKGLHKTLLQKLAPNSEANKENQQPNGFRSSNLELDSYAKLNKRIRPRGEFYSRKKKN
jgi:hypothetical protein